MAVDIPAVFASVLTFAEQSKTAAAAGLSTAYSAFATAGAYQYAPYEWQAPSPPAIGFNPGAKTPIHPTPKSAPDKPSLDGYPDIGEIDMAGAPTFTAREPTYKWPNVPSGPPNDTTGTVPKVYVPHYPNKPNMYSLPAATLPYLTLKLPDVPEWEDPVLKACPPMDIQTISLDDYLQMLTDAYDNYADTIPRLVQSHWIEWYRAMLGENPLIDKIENVLSSYYNTGGAGIPVPIEEAIVTRATDRVTAEYKRAQATVFDNATRRGFLLPSGTMVAGLKEARQIAAEAVSKVATDVAIKNLELEHDYMKFMLQLGVELEKTLLSFAGDLAKTVVECNSQAIEMTKQILTGMLAINDANVKIYIAKWTGYTAAVEAYKAMWQGIEAKIRVYEAEIRAELAKTEINKAYVEVLTAMVNANKALVDLYKAEVDAETAKIEGSRVAILGYQAAVQAYVAKIEAYKAQWQGYAAANEGQVALAKTYEASANAFAASVNAYKASIEGQAEKIRAKAVHIDAVAKKNEGLLKGWAIELDGTLKAYSTSIEAYKAEWQAEAERIRGYTEATRIMGDFAARMYSGQIQMDIERSHQHLAEWTAQINSVMEAAKGVTAVAAATESFAASALTAITTFAGELASKQV